jgi:hypothetical protein
MMLYQFGVRALCCEEGKNYRRENNITNLDAKTFHKGEATNITSPPYFSDTREVLHHHLQ